MIEITKGPSTIESYRDEHPPWDFNFRLSAAIKEPPTRYIMNVPPMGGIGGMYAMCLNELAKQKGDYSVEWRVYPR